MPKQRITKDMVVEATFEIARQGGMEKVMVKSIADKLGCSVQPIYSYCTSMEGLREEVENRARCFIEEYMKARIDKEDLFRSTGRAYIRLAGEEPHILKIFIMQERKNISSLEDIYKTETNPKMAEGIAQELHLNMLIYSIGLGTIFSVSSPGIPINEIFVQQEQACRAFTNDILRMREKSDENSGNL